MKKFINDPKEITNELLEGLVYAFPQFVCRPDPVKPIIVNAKLDLADRVTTVSFSGAGHEPGLCGFVGEGLLDAIVSGNVFAAPGTNDVVQAMTLADKGKGILLLVLNHAGDMMAADIAQKKFSKAGGQVMRVNIQDDINTAPRSESYNRRGLVGMFPAAHIAGAAAAKGYTLEEVHAVTQRIADNMATILVASSGAMHPSTGKVIMSFDDDDMEIGAGMHGEGGGERMKMLSADQTADIMMERLLNDLEVKSGEKLLVIVSGNGATTLLEQLIVFRRCRQILDEKGIILAGSYVGELMTVQEASGFHMSIARVDEELLTLWNAPCLSAYYAKY